MKNKTMLCISLLTCCFASTTTLANDVSVSIGIGETILNSDARIGEVAIEYKNWQLAASVIGAGETRNGFQKTVHMYSINRIKRTGKKFLGGELFYQVGVGKVGRSNLVGPYNFFLGAGVEFKTFSLKLFHSSSANIYEPNTGIDGFLINKKF